MQFVSYFFFLNTDDTQCNAQMTSETLLINCSSRVHISFTVYFGLAFAFSLRFAFAYRSACAHCSNGKSKMFQELYYKAITHESYTEKYLPHFVFTPLALVSAGEVGTGWIPMSKLSLFDHNFVWANLRPVETICKTAKITQYTVCPCKF